MQTLDRLSAQDATFLYAESPRMPMHVGGFAVIDRLALGPDELIDFIERRSASEPRMRQRVVDVPGDLGRPALIADDRFDIRQHVHPIATPRPYDDDRAVAFVEELMQQPLRRDVPLWHLWTFDMTEERTGAILCVHHCLTDGIAGLGFAMGLLSAEPDEQGHDEPPPAADPSAPPAALELMAGAAVGFLSDQTKLARTVGRAILPGGGAYRTLLGVPGSAARAVRRISQPSTGSLFEPVGAQRSFATLTLELADVKGIAMRHGGKFNDVVLASTTAGLRAALRAGRTDLDSLAVTASVPVNMRTAEDQSRNSLSQLVVELPVGEDDPVARLKAVIRRTERLKASAAAGQGAGLMQLADAAPAPVLRIASRLLASRTAADLLVTNLRGPELPLYLMGARLRALYPIGPLAGTSAVSVAIVSYDGRVFVGVSADRQAIGDLELLLAAMRADIDALLTGGR